MRRLIVAVFLAGLAVMQGFGSVGGQTISLNGEWKLDYFPQPVSGAIRTLPLSVPCQTVKATVPGNCERDLVNAGVLPPFEIGLNVRKAREYEGHQWLYTKSFTIDGRDKVCSSRKELVFDGIDTLADVFLNGEKIGEAANMLIPHRFDVTARLKPGTNTVQVLIRSALYESQGKTVGELGYHLGFADNEPFRKAGHMGGWDIFPRLSCAGLWRDVSIAFCDPVRIGNVAWICGDFDRDFTRCRVSAQFRVQGAAETFAWGNRIRIALSRGGEVKFSSEREYVAVQNMQAMDVDRPELWWPKGMGEPNLYDATIEVLAKDGAVLARDARKIGIRLVTLERDDVYGKDRPGQFLFRVNGEPCYIRGSNWVPLDALPSRQAGRIVETLEMFEDLNCNMVRVWGGGVYEPAAFFDWCDAHGLMVWQDFMTGCAVFPQGDEYAKATEREVRDVVLAFRNHPSLVLWSGNNENDESFAWRSFREFRRNPNQDRSSRRTIPDVLYEFDVTRPYLPSSPYRPPDVVAGIAKPSEMHLWGARGYYKTDYYTNSPCWFASEMGYHGAPNRDSLARMMTEGGVYPWKGTPAAFEKDIAKLDWNDEWRLKSSNPYMKGSPSLWKRNDLMTNQIRIMFGGVDTDLDTFIAQSQFVQAEAMKTFCELFRSRKFTRFNGLIWWNMRDGWPQISDAVVDYYGGKKRAYFALKDAQRDVLALLVDDHTAWVVNDLMRPVKGHVTYRDKASGMVLLDGDYAVEANAKTKLGTVPFSGQGLVEIEYTVDGGPVQRNHFLYGEPPFRWEDVKAWLPDAPRRMRLGCQLWGVKEFWEKDPEKGFAEVFPKLRAMGYEGVQSMAFWKIAPDRLEALLKANDLALVDMPVNFEHVEGTNVESTVAFCRRFGVDFVYIPWFQGKTADDWRTFCGRLAAAGKRLAPYGLRIGYHNHVHEFTKPLDGEYPADILKADRNVNLELDIGPVTESGNDAPAWIAALSGRVPGMHAKPHGASAAGAPGDVQDWPKVIAAARKAGVKWFVVECEKRKDTYDDVATSAAYLKPLLDD